MIPMLDRSKELKSRRDALSSKAERLCHDVGDLIRQSRELIRLTEEAQSRITPMTAGPSG